MHYVASLSITTISALSWFRAVKDRLRSFECSIGRSIGFLDSAESATPSPLAPYHLLPRSVVSNAACARYDAPLWNMAIIASRLHLTWIATVCGKLETRYRYSNTLGWNSFPVPVLTAIVIAHLPCLGRNR